MIKKLIVFIFALLAFAIPASRAWAIITIYGIPEANKDQPSYKYDRFYDEESPAKDFIGEEYDWSGVGRSTNGRWLTMISSQYFLTAKHYYPSGSVTFYENNSSDDPAQSHTYTIGSIVANFGDLAIGQLTTQINPDDDIAYYPILDFDNLVNYKGQTFYAYGQLNRVGRNKIDATGLKEVEQSGVVVETYSMTYNYQAPPKGLGADECLLEAGDSGGPSFVVYNGELALVGIHWFKYDDDSGSGDSFAPYYIDDIMSVVDVETATPFGGDANMDGIVDDLDAAILASNWHKSGAFWTQGDFSGDRFVNEVDAAIMSANWLRTASDTSLAATAVPEPGMVFLFFSGLLLVFGLFAAQTQAAMLIYGYTPSKHDRFYEGAGRDFIGEGYDWSGVGVAWQQYEEEGDTKYNVKWVTMISPRYFLTSKQTNVAAAGDVTFYAGNSLSGPSYSYEIASIVPLFGDIALGCLAEDIDASIAYYPIMKFPVAGTYKDYNHLPFFAYGHGGSYPSTTENCDPRVGRNQIDRNVSLPIGGTTTRAITYNFDSPLSGGLGDDECLPQLGDLGAPSFLVCNGELALVGIHGNIAKAGVDSFVSYYSNGILSACPGAETISPLAGDANLDGIVDEGDAALMAANWLRSSGALWAQGDFNGNGIVNDADATILAANWHRSADAGSSAAATAVPEPGVAALFLSLSVFFVARLSSHD